MLRDQVFVLDHMYMSLFSTCGWILRLGVTIALLVSIHPALALLAVVRAADRARPRPGGRRVERAAQERGAPPNRLARHLFTRRPPRRPGRRCASPASAIGWSRERRAGVGARLRADRGGALGIGGLAHARVGDLRRRVRRRGRVRRRRACDAPAGDVLLVLAAGARLSAYIGATVGEIGFLRGFWVDGSRRLAWLEDYAASLDAAADVDGARAARATASASSTCRSRIPAPTRLVLEDVILALPAGTVVAIVGENGAGQDHARQAAREDVRADGRRDPRRRASARAHAGRRVARAARRRVPGFLPLRVPRAAHASGSATCRGSTTSRRCEPRSTRAGADDVDRASCRRGLDTQLGPTWPGGVDVSFGQWQKLALARGFMRDEPLLLVLDEPTAALDAETEHALFERYAAAARDRPADPAASRFSSLTGSRPCAWRT